METERFAQFKKAVLDQVCSAIVGKRETAELVLTCFVCSGHVLLEDVPGTGKTMMLAKRGPGRNSKSPVFWL